MTLISAPPQGRPVPTSPVAARAPEQPGAFAAILRGAVGAKTAAREDFAATGAGHDPAASAPVAPPQGLLTGQPPATESTSGLAGTDMPASTDAAPSVTATPSHGVSVPPTAAATALATVDANTTAGMMAAGDSAASPVEAPPIPPSPSAQDDAHSSAPAGVGAGLGTTTTVLATGQSNPIVGPPSGGLATSTPPQAIGTGTGTGQVPARSPESARVRSAETTSAQPGAGTVPGTPVTGGTPGASGTSGTGTPTLSVPTAGFPTGITVPADSASSPASQPSGVPERVPAEPVALRQQPAADPAGLVPVVAGAATTLPAPAAVTTPPVTAHALSQAPAQPLSTQLAQPLFSLGSARPGEHVMTVQVTPENLGPVTVRAVIGADVRIELFSPSEGGREALRQILTDLRRDLAGGGLSASLDLSSRNEAGGGEQRTPLRQAPRSGAAAPEPVIEQRAALASPATTTLDITV